MATLIFSIETVASDWGLLSANAQKLLKRKKPSGQKLEEYKAGLSLSPLTGQIVSLAMYDVERNLGAVYCVGAGSDIKDESFMYKVRSEREILEDFWEGACRYDTFVTFNGRSFAWPFLNHRSAINKISPSIEIDKHRYLINQGLPYQIDLLDELTMYGAMRPNQSLQLFLAAYDIAYKSKYQSLDIAKLYKAGKFGGIAEKNSADVLSIMELYEVWQEYFAPRSFLNTR